jgi:hypothetical protein
MSSSWRTRCRGSASCRRPSARRADACWRIQQMHRAANERCRHLKMFPVSGQVRAAGAGSAGSNVPGFCGSDAIGLSPARSCRAPGSTSCSSPDASEFQAGAGAGAAATAERGPDRHHHGIRRLAVALGAGVLCRVVRKKLGLKLASEKTDAGRAGSRFRTLRHNWGRLRPHRHDPHHAQAARRKRLIMNPNFPDGLLAGE